MIMTMKDYKEPLRLQGKGIRCFRIKSQKKKKLFGKEVDGVKIGLHLMFLKRKLLMAIRQ